MSYLEAKYHLLGGWRVIAFLLNVLVFLGGFWGLYLTGIFTRSWYDEGTAAVCLLVIFTSALSAFLITRPLVLEKSDDEKVSLLSLWWKRKKLENLAKINEFKK
ncbi:hypothetical protein [Citrobacter koseri]|uniref:hypothetical protein n=1 Tax=Citrobacter koseri TaxID=545 RepID=UPI001F4837E8|nr:hypothetical protein [Citrobacter koseri]